MSPKSEFWKDGQGILRLTQENMIGFDEECLRSTSNKNYYGSVKKSKCSFSCHLQIDKKIDNVNKNRSKSKNWFKLCLWGFSKKESYVAHISFYTTRGWNSRKFQIARVVQQSTPWIVFSWRPKKVPLVRGFSPSLLRMITLQNP